MMKLNKLIYFGSLLYALFIVYWMDLFRARYWNYECKCKTGVDNRSTTESKSLSDPLHGAPWPWPWLSTEAVMKLKESECAPPILNPLNPNMSHVFFNQLENCSDSRQTYYFEAVAVSGKNGDSSVEIVMMQPLPDTMKCCIWLFRVKERGQNTTIRENESDICTVIKRNGTKVPNDSHFITIKCWWNATILKNGTLNSNGTKFSHQELLTIFPQPSRKLLDSKARLLAKDNTTRRTTRLSIISIGFDHVSRMSFIRQMNSSYKYLKSQLGAIDLHGFNKIGDRTLDNTLAFLTGYDLRAVEKNRNWWNPNSTYYDKLPFIWKNLSELGYITSFASDWNSVFDYLYEGFKNMPTDYYLNSLLQGRNTLRTNPNSDGHCIGKDLEFDLFQNYVVKTSSVLRDHPYFQFVWSAQYGLYPPYASMGDNGLLSALRHFNSSGVLNKSLVIIWSDHGWRLNPVLNFSQARIESKMPFCFLLLPKWFESVYPKAYKNLRENQYKLTTAYDIHSTLEDMLNPEANLNDDGFCRTKLNPNSYGISLFRTIPKNRSCEDAGVDDVWCSCSTYVSIMDKREVADKLAGFAVDTINSLLKPYNYCEEYRVEKILRADVKVDSQKSANYDLSLKNTFKIVFTLALKSNGTHLHTFEVFVSTQPKWMETGTRDFVIERKFMDMSDVVVRLTNYGVSSCMTVIGFPPICTCKNKKSN